MTCHVTIAKLEEVDFQVQIWGDEERPSVDQYIHLGSMASISVTVSVFISVFVRVSVMASFWMTVSFNIALSFMLSLWVSVRFNIQVSIRWQSKTSRGQSSRNHWTLTRRDGIDRRPIPSRLVIFFKTGPGLVTPQNFVKIRPVRSRQNMAPLDHPMPSHGPVLTNPRIKQRQRCRYRFK